MATPLHTALLSARPYPVYRQFLTDLLEKEGRTTGDNQSELYVSIAKLNQARMGRLDRKNRLTDEFRELLTGLTKNYTILVLTEGWCGDAAQIVPVLNWMAEASPRVQLFCALRDANLPLMDQFLTNGGRSIPKVFFLEAGTENILATWGPRPLIAQTISMAYKRKPEPKESYEVHHAELHKWYARDKTLSTQAELQSILTWLESSGQ
ncbi:thioredoxin family protein [Lewinella sp. 4G2]|uniref:thioredoxin family protein n=1 Tax=Lewinella sp. 4G2 TaxID=1803372 RepID=UPI0007B49700|nr:thioredoxin family protein [Lewinella sp. 4G2]OAV42802.1 hypothetical protein A3850_016340 [Lewinella sp. 4G2]